MEKHNQHLSTDEKKLFEKSVFAEDHKSVDSADKLIFEIIAKKLLAIEDKEDMILFVLKAIHDGWCLDNAGRFEKKISKGQEYQFLPLQMIGYEEATSDLLFVRPILAAVGVQVNDEKLQHAFAVDVAKFFNENNISSKEALKNYVLHGKYSARTEATTPKDELVTTTRKVNGVPTEVKVNCADEVTKAVIDRLPEMTNVNKFGGE